MKSLLLNITSIHSRAVLYTLLLFTSSQKQETLKASRKPALVRYSPDLAAPRSEQNDHITLVYQMKGYC